MYLPIDHLSKACEFSNLKLPLGKYTVVNLCSVFNLFNTLPIVSFLNSIPLSDKINPDGPIHGKSMQVNIHFKTLIGSFQWTYTVQTNAVKRSVRDG